RPSPVRAVLRRGWTLRSRRFVGSAPTDFLDGDLELFQEVRGNLAFRVRVRSGRQRNLRGERAGDCAPLPRGRSMEPWMLEEHAVLRRPRSGPESEERRARGAREVGRPHTGWGWVGGSVW